MAFFDLNRKIQVILIASGLSMSAAPGCKPPAVEGPDSPEGPRPDEQVCASLDLGDADVVITQAGSTSATVQIRFSGKIPRGTELTLAATGQGFVVQKSEMTAGEVTLVLDHSSLEAGETGTVLVDVSGVCGAHEGTFRHRIHLCKQAGGIKILDDAQGVCQAPPPPPADTSTDPGAPDPVIVDPAPPPPYDPPPPPPYDPPPPPPADPVPNPAPVPDPVPPPADASTKKDPAPEPFIVDCVPDAMQPRASTGDEPALLDAPVLGASLTVRKLDLHRWQLTASLGVPAGMEARVQWSASGGQIGRREGETTVWSAPDDGRVHTVMAAVSDGSRVTVLTWKRVP